jgi:hypothetical protein
MRLPHLILIVAWMAGCSTERTEYHYRPDYVAINQGRPLEETYYRPDGTKVVITSKVPGLDAVPPAAEADTKAGTSAPVDERGIPRDAVLQIHTPDMVVEAFMQGLREQDYAALYDHLVSPQQRDRMGGERGRAEFVTFCEANRRELMASAIRLVSAIRGNSAVITTVSGDMTRYQLPEADRGQFGFTIVEVERAADGNLRLAGVR